MLSALLIVSLAFAVIFLTLSVKKLAKEECLVFFRNGKPDKLAGPGVVFALPGVQRTTRLDLGTHALSLPEVYSAPRSSVLLVTGRFAWKIVDPIKAVTSPDLNRAVESVLVSNLRDIFLNATFSDCLLDPFELTRVAEDLINEKTTVFGVKITKLEFVSFPAHQFLGGQLAYLLGSLIVELEALTGHGIVECD